MGRSSGAVRIFGNGKEAFVNSANALNVNVEETLFTFSADYAEAQSNVVIITPTSGKKLHIVCVFASTETIDTDITLTINSGSKVVFKLYTSKTQATGSTTCHYDGNTDETLNLTCGVGTFVSITYKEHD